MKKISFIVPVYNVQKYIKQCVESLCNQTIKDIEIIIVDDGSEDDSIKIIKQFNDKRILIISQENRGLSAARNAGLEIANGEYIAFIDSDDFIGDNKAYEEMYNIAINEKSEIVAGNAIWYYSEEKKYTMLRDKTLFFKSPMDSEQFFISCMKSNMVYAPVWLNLYKRSILVNNNIWFKEGVYHEDEEFTPRVLLKANKVSIYNKTFYIYRQRGGSITNSNLSFKKGMDFLEICLQLENILSDIRNDELKFLFKKYLAGMSIEQIYKYKFKEIPLEIKGVIKRNSVTKGLKVRSKLINISPQLFLFIEYIYRNIKKYILYILLI